MRLLSIEQKGYLPYTHTGTHFLHIDFMEKVTAIMASNGFGKSSLLREITPYPSTRTDYQKNGYVKKCYKHGSHIYELTSDYKNASAPHSFKEDGIELNISGTTDTQKDLIEEKFSLSTVVEDLMSGKFGICDMRVSERKALFSTMYPSDLTFMLDYHKQVCSQIRVLSNQIKLLKTRDTSLRGKLMSPEQIDSLSKTKKEYDYVINLIDKLNLVLEGENERLRHMKEYQLNVTNQYTVDMFNRSTADSELVDELERMADHFQQLVHINSSLSIPNSDISKGITIMEQRIGDLNSSEISVLKALKDSETRVEKIRDDLDNYISCKNANKCDDKLELEKSIEHFKKMIASRDVDYDISKIIPKAVIDSGLLTNGIPELNRLTCELCVYAGSLLSRQDIDKLKKDVDTNILLQSSRRGELTRNEERLVYFNNRINQLKTKGYPSDCMRGCGIRESLTKMLSDTEAQRDLLLDNKSKLTKELDDLIKEENEIMERLQAPCLAIPIIERIWNVLSRYSLTEIVLNEGSFISYLNENCTDLVNQVVKITTTSEDYWVREEYKNDLKIAEGKLETLKNAEKHMLSIEFLNNVIAESEYRLDEELRHVKRYASKLDRIKSDRGYNEDMITILNSIKHMSDDCIALINHDKLHKRIEFNTMIINEHINIRNEINSRLREIESTLYEQNNYKTIVTQEIEPTLKELTAKVKKWEQVEFGLSPTKGLPYIYLTRFINRLISHVNSYIRDVWCYDMELVYLKEEETLDFSIQVMINKSSIVKDISICSAGQKAIINLAMILAICKERTFGNIYPLKLDEVDAALTDEHRTNLVALLSRLVDSGEISQMFLVNHFVIHSGMTNCETVCLSTDGIVVPNVYNEHVQIA